MNRQLSALGAGGFQKIAHHRLQLFDVTQRNSKVLFLLVCEISGKPVQDNRNKLIHGGERRAQLVRYVGEKLIFG